MRLPSCIGRSPARLLIAHNSDVCTCQRRTCTPAPLCVMPTPCSPFICRRPHINAGCCIADDEDVHEIVPQDLVKPRKRRKLSDTQCKSKPAEVVSEQLLLHTATTLPVTLRRAARSK